MGKERLAESETITGVPAPMTPSIQTMIDEKLTNTLPVECVEPSIRASSRCTRNDVVIIQRTVVTSLWANCNQQQTGYAPVTFVIGLPFSQAQSMNTLYSCCLWLK